MQSIEDINKLLIDNTLLRLYIYYDVRYNFFVRTYINYNKLAICITFVFIIYLDTVTCPLSVYKLIEKIRASQMKNKKTLIELKMCNENF